MWAQNTQGKHVATYKRQSFPLDKLVKRVADLLPLRKLVWGACDRQPIYLPPRILGPNMRTLFCDPNAQERGLHCPQIESPNEIQSGMYR